VPDVAIIHAADKGTAAARLAEAIVAAGFAVGALEIEDPAELAAAVDGCGAEARILIWSRPLVSHALHSGELARIRQLRGLIEVSADGIAPPSRGDGSQVVSISGWRGQPFHPGWQRIHAELKRLCGSRKAPPEAAPPPTVAKNPDPGRAEPPGPRAGARPRAPRLVLGAGAAVLLVAAAVGAANWVGRGAPDPAPPPQQVGEARPPAAISEPAPPDPGTAPRTADVSVTSPPAAPSPAPPVAANAEPQASPARPVERPAPSRSSARPKQPPSTSAAPVKKYSRKHSKVMREFCERSGRSTPQCRTFLRSTREADD
jgi:hypothetical protein